MQEITKLTSSALLSGWIVCREGRKQHAQQNLKCFELYIPAISDKLRKGFIINHRNAVLPVRRTAWWARAWDLRVLLACSELQPQATPSSLTPLKSVFFLNHYYFPLPVCINTPYSCLFLLISSFFYLLFSIFAAVLCPVLLFLY